MSTPHTPQSFLCHLVYHYKRRQNRTESWLCKLNQSAHSQKPHEKQCTPAIQAPGKQRQADPWKSPASQSSQSWS